MIKNVAEYLEYSAKRFPNKISYSDGTCSLTYAQLRHDARALATAISNRGVFKQPILLALNKSPRVVTSFMAAAYSGNFYVPLDIEMPPERVAKIVDQIKPAVCIAESSHVSLLREANITDDSILLFEENICCEINDALLAKAEFEQIDSDLLYVLFTSGSTGNPKGVCITHKAVIDYAEQITEVFKYDENTTWGQSHPFTFDASLMVIYSTLKNGGTDYILSKKLLMFPSLLIPFLNEHKVNSVFWVPTLYNNIVKSGILDKVKPQYINRFLFSGEVMPCTLLNAWRRLYPDAMFANIYGPTEITDSNLYYIVNRDFKDSDELPIGIQYNNVRTMILNEANRIAETGEIGEICIRGSKVSPGYYNDFDRTSSAFVQNPLNTSYREYMYRSGDLGYVNEYGEIMFVGRKDFQIKHLGYRIELGEIESAAQWIEGLLLCGCVYDSDKKQIVLFYTGDVSDYSIRDILKSKLQSYMVPDRIIHLEEMPKTSSDKIDRVRLKGMLT